MLEDNTPLVSVVIVTYNSSETVIETLESIYNQTYKNLELIVSDDKSKDSTIELCSDWIQKKKDRFYNVRLLQVEKNTGISANLNRAIRETKGIWIKSLAGDDLLEPKCIEECVNFVNIKHSRICMVKLSLLGGNEKDNQNTERILQRMYDSLKSEDRKIQYKKALYSHILPGPGIFYSKELWSDIGGFDENYRDFEEYSFELKVFRIEKVCFLNMPLVKWRQREGSLTHTIKSPATINDIRFYYEYRRPLLRLEHLWLEIFDRDIYYGVINQIEFLGKSKYYKLFLYISPLHIIKVIKGLA